MEEKNIQIRIHDPSSSTPPSSTDILVQSKQDEVKLLSIICESGELGFMESYLDGLWYCNDLKGLFTEILQTNASYELKTFSTLLSHQLNKWINFQTVERSKDVIDIHYNLGNRFYESLLGPSMQYSCGYWKPNAGDKPLTLTQAQLQKMDLIARKLDLRPECRVLDIGCGFGIWLTIFQLCVNKLLELHCRKISLHGRQTHSKMRSNQANSGSFCPITAIYQKCWVNLIESCQLDSLNMLELRIYPLYPE